MNHQSMSHNYLKFLSWIYHVIHYLRLVFWIGYIILKCMYKWQGYITYKNNIVYNFDIFNPFNTGKNVNFWYAVALM